MYGELSCGVKVIDKLFSPIFSKLISGYKDSFAIPFACFKSNNWQSNIKIFLYKLMLF